MVARCTFALPEPGSLRPDNFMVFAVGHQGHQAIRRAEICVFFCHRSQSIETWHMRRMARDHWSSVVHALSILQDPGHNGSVGACLGIVANPGHIFGPRERLISNLLSMHPCNSVLMVDPFLAGHCIHSTSVHQPALDSGHSRAALVLNTFAMLRIRTGFPCSSADDHTGKIVLLPGEHWK